MIAHLAGLDHDFLLFDYPLTGTFEFSVDGYVGAFAESGISAGGLVVEPMILRRAARSSRSGRASRSALPGD